MSTGSSVKVSIFGNEYRVSGEGNEDYIQKLADYVDHTMREISHQGRHVSSERIAILAAFNIADQLFQLGKTLAQHGLEGTRGPRLRAKVQVNAQEGKAFGLAEQVLKVSSGSQGTTPPC